jgi:RNA polymerase sigma factor (sigma-70 family)
MRKRDPKHETSLNALIKLSIDDIKRLVSIDDYHHSDFIASEVLASLVRIKYGEQSGLLEVIVKSLHKRVIKGIQGCIKRNETLQALVASNSELVQEIASYFWEKLIEDKQVVSNSEVRFGVYLQNRVIDCMRHQLIDENSRESIDSFTSVDEEGNTTSFIDTVPSDPEDSPEVSVIRAQEQSILMNALMQLPKDQRDAFYFRNECDYDWEQVSEFLNCSVPTARKLYKLSIEKLQGVLK